jgi:succinate dehydrogenase/fumarate reductase flavoprotein subunit
VGVAVLCSPVVQLGPSAHVCCIRPLCVVHAMQVGGNSAKATSGINGWGTRQQLQGGVNDEEKMFERDTHRSGVGGGWPHTYTHTTKCP